MTDPTTLSPEQVEWALRVEWFMNHGHESPAQYVDDGEMQCQLCVTLGGWDYKRMPIGELQAVVQAARWKRTEASMLKARAEWHERMTDDL